LAPSEWGLLNQISYRDFGPQKRETAPSVGEFLKGAPCKTLKGGEKRLKGNCPIKGERLYKFAKPGALIFHPKDLHGGTISGGKGPECNLLKRNFHHY